MRRRPWPLIVISFFFLLSPITSLVFSAQMHGVSISYFLNAVLQSKPIEGTLTYICLPFLAAISLWSFRKWSYWTFSSISVVFVIKNIIAIVTSGFAGAHLGMLYMALFANTLVMAYFFLPGLRNFYERSDLHWWKARKRYQFKCSALMSNKSVEIQDISCGGVFVQPHNGFKTGDSLFLQFQYADRHLEMKARVVYEKPSGLGLEFTDLNAQTMRDIKFILSDLVARKAPMRNAPNAMFKDFLLWVKQAFKDPRELLVTVRK